jgi:predicted PurR-regulated permease PerM
VDSSLPDAPEGTQDIGDAERADATSALAPVATRPWWELARIVALVLAALVLVQMVGRLGDVISLVLLAATMALLTDPFRRRLARRLRPGAAVVLTALATLVVILTLAGLLFRDVSAQAERLSDELIERIEDLSPGSLPARVADSLDAVEGIEDVFARLPSVVVANEENVSGLGREAIDTLLVVILAAFFQSGAASMLDAAVKRWRRDDRKAVRDLATDVEQRGGGYVRRTVLMGGGVALVVATTAFALDVAGPVVLGAWAGLCVTVPAIGWFIGFAPAVAVGFVESPADGFVLAAVCVVLTVLVAILRRRLIRRVRLRPGAALSALAFATGIASFGFGGALVAFVAMGLVVAVLTTDLVLPRPAPDDDAEVAAPRGADLLLRPEAGHVRVAPGWRGALTVLGAAVAGTLLWMLAGSIGRVAVWLVIASLVAIALSRPVGWVSRRLRLPRSVAVVGVFLVALAVVGAAVLAGIDGGTTTSSELAEELPTIVEEMESLPLLGSWLEDRDAAVWVSDQMTNLPQRLQEARDVSEWLPTIGARVFDLFWTGVLALVLLLDGPRLVSAVERRVPARKRRQFARMTAVSERAIGGYLMGAALVAGINATVVFVIALALGIALAPVLALWAFVWNFVPQIGGFMGGFPLVVLALAAGPMQAVLAGVLFVTYQFIENHLIQPAVIAEAIDVPPWATLLAALAGGAAAGVMGAVVLTPLVGVIRVVIAERNRDDFPGATVPTTPDDTGPSPEPSPATALV